MKNITRIFKVSKKIIGGVLLVPSIYATGQNPQQPNIIVFIADDISMNDFSCYGHPVVKTPNIDNLANNGIRFSNVFLTTSSSSPSRASIITGRYPHNTGACELHTPIGTEQVFLPKILKDAGYYTAQAGKWHLGESSSKADGPGVKAFDRIGGGANDGGGPSGAEKWVNYLKERPKEKPFFMWFASHDAHRAWDNDIFLEKYHPDSVDVSPFYVDDVPSREDIASYYNEISRFDYFIGQVIEELKKQDILDNTFIVVMADNGRPFPRAKTRLIPDGIKTPFIIHYPKGIDKKGSTSNSLISVIDLAPTLTSLAGIEKSPTFQGESFDQLLKEPNKKFRNYVFAEHNWHDYEACERMVCDGNFLLIENKRPHLSAIGAIDVMNGGVGTSLMQSFEKNRLNDLQKDIFSADRPSLELYRYKTDKYQLSNLIEELPKESKKLLNVLRLWQKETGDSYPDDITHDWYSRKTFKALPSKGDRKEMPGTSNDAKNNKNSGPF